MKKKKILVISVGVVPPSVLIGGMAAVYHLVSRLAQEDLFEIHVLTALPRRAGSEIEDWAHRQKEKNNLTLHFVKSENPLLIRLLFFIKALSLNTKYKFDLIHDYSSSPLLVGLTGILGKLCGCKTLHTLCVVNEGLLGSEKLTFGFPWVDGVICTAPNLFPSEKGTKYLPLGINTEDFKPHLKDFARTVLFLGSLIERKGAAVLLRAAKGVIEKHPDAKFIFASYGRGELDPNYDASKKILQKMSLGFQKNVEFLTGMEDVPKLLGDADIFVLPATSLHGTLSPPLTLIEAMSAGKPCVVSDVCRGDGLVEDGVNCLLFQSGNVGDLSDKMNLLLDDEALREKLAKNARQKVVEQFEINKVAAELSKVYLIRFDNSQK